MSKVSSKTSQNDAGPADIDVRVFENTLDANTVSLREKWLAAAALYAYLLAVRTPVASFPKDAVFRGFKATFNAVRDRLPGVPESIPNPLPVTDAWDTAAQRAVLTVFMAVAGHDGATALVTRIGVANPTDVQFAAEAAPALEALLNRPEVEQAKPLMLVSAWKALVANGALPGDLAAEVLLRARSGTGTGWVAAGDPMLLKVPPQVVAEVREEVRNPPSAQPASNWKSYAIYGGAAVLALLAIRHALKGRRGSR